MTDLDEPDTTPGGYLFRSEVIEAVLQRFLPPVSDEELDVQIREHMDWPELDELDQVHVLIQQDFTCLAATVVAALAVREERQAAIRSERLARIDRHNACDQVLDDLLSERNDLIAGLWDVRDACSYSSENQYGNHYVNRGDLLEALRPRTPGKGDRRGLPGDDRGWWCPECGSPDFHQGDCSIDLHAKDLAIRAGHERASHVRCSEIATELIDQIADLHLQVEARAAQILSAAQYTYHEGQIVYVERVKDFLASVPTPKAVTLTATIYPSIADREE